MKELLAGLILTLLIVCAAINVNYVGSITAELVELVEAADTLELADKALDRWNDLSGYTHIFIRHTEVDIVRAEFYALIERITLGEASYAARRLLVSHLQEIHEMEKVRWGTIF
jgi:sensor histidine kinase YesM